MSEIDTARLRANLEKGFLPNRGEALALIDALEKARRAPSQSDERKMQEAACCSDGCCLDPAKCMAGHQVVPKAYLRVVAAVRAEATLAGAAAKREACAKLIEENSILFCSEGPNQLRPRMDGDRTGLDYAAAIRGGKP